MIGGGAPYLKAMAQIAALCIKYRMPTLINWPEFARAGLLISYSISQPDLCSQVGKLCCTHPVRQQARGAARRAAHPVRVGGQRKNRQRARPWVASGYPQAARGAPQTQP